ncbi:MAG: hypothetical protein JNL82_16160 [Myxococcales bacterium]|nr:hypothetical protein [Myxococcales bacterium]
MDKIRLRARAFDGATLYEPVPTFRQVEGWMEASLEAPVGIVPAALWGKVPGGDPYLLHINALTTVPLGPGDLFELQSGPPVQPRVQYRPTPDNTRLVLVRPSDRLRLLIAPQNPEIVIELLVESIGGTNELGSRLYDWSQSTAAASATAKATSLTMAGPGGIPAWTGQLHIVHDSANADAITLPTRGLVPLDAMLTFTRAGAGTPVLTASAGDELAGGLANFPVTRSVFVMNNGDAWAFAGV